MPRRLKSIAGFAVAGLAADARQGLVVNLQATGVRRDDVLIVLYETHRESWSLGNGEAQLLDTELLCRHGWTPPDQRPEEAAAEPQR